MVYFNGDSKFKTELPSNVLSYGLGSYIEQFNDIVLSDTEIQRICDLLISTEGKILKQEHPTRENYAQGRLEIRSQCNEISSKLE